MAFNFRKCAVVAALIGVGVASASLVVRVSPTFAGGVQAGAPVIDRFDAHCADIAILQMKAVQADLGVTKAQRDKMNAFAKHQNDLRSGYIRQIQGTKTNPNPELIKYFSELKDNVLGILSPAQLKRLREITLQNIGLVSLCDPEVSSRVGMGPQQVDRMQEAYREGLQAFNTAQQAAIRPVVAQYANIKPKSKEQAAALQKQIEAKFLVAKKKIAPQLNAIRDKYNVKMRGILTPAQLRTYDSLRGRPFKG